MVPPGHEMSLRLVQAEARQRKSIDVTMMIQESACRQSSTSTRAAVPFWESIAVRHRARSQLQLGIGPTGTSQECEKQWTLQLSLPVRDPSGSVRKASTPSSCHDLLPIDLENCMYLKMQFCSHAFSPMSRLRAARMEPVETAPGFPADPWSPDVSSLASEGTGALTEPGHRRLLSSVSA